MNKLLLVIASLFIVSCVGRWHQIAGGTSGWNMDEVNVISDIMVTNLQIRHVRMPSTFCSQGHIDHIELNGIINKDSLLVIERLLNKVDRCTDDKGVKYAISVFMNSSGGSLSYGYKIGRLFRKHNVGTTVTGGQECSSSCAVAFLGGNYRYLKYSGILMFHAPYVITGSSNLVINCAAKSSRIELKEYYIEMLGETAGKVLFDRTMDYCSTSKGWKINADAAKIFGITTTL